MVVPQLVSVNKSWTGVFNSQLTETYTTRYINGYEFTYKIVVMGAIQVVTPSPYIKKGVLWKTRKKKLL